MNFFLMKVFSEGGRIGLQGASGRMLVPEAVGAVLENNGYVGKEEITGIRAEDVCLSRPQRTARTAISPPDSRA